MKCDVIYNKGQDMTTSINSCDMIYEKEPLLKHLENSFVYIDAVRE